MSVFLILVGIAVAGVFVFLMARSFEAWSSHENQQSPEDEPYPSGSRMGGPGAEGMAVGEGGDIYPGTPGDDSGSSPTDEQPGTSPED